MNTIEGQEKHAFEPASPPVGETTTPAPSVAKPPTPEPPQVPPPRKSRKPLLVALSSVALIILAAIGYWKRASLQGVNPYIPVAIPSLIAASQIRFKDWNSYNPKSIRYLLLLAVFIACGWGILYQNQQMRDKAAASARADTAQKAQQDNTTQFLSHLGTLSDKITGLETKVATAEFQKELSDVRGELEKTQLALAPAPKAALSLSFPGYANTSPGEHFTPLTEMTIPATAEGAIKVPFRVVNATDADATQGHFSVIVCDECKYVKDPERFRHLNGAPETERYIEFPYILASTALPVMELELTIPKWVQTFIVGIQYRCRTCVLNKNSETLTVHVSWPK